MPHVWKTTCSIDSKTTLSLYAKNNVKYIFQNNLQTFTFCIPVTACSNRKRGVISKGLHLREEIIRCYSFLNLPFSFHTGIQDTMFRRTRYPFLLSLLLELQLLLLLTFESLIMPDPLMTNRAEGNLTWTRLTAVTAKGVYTVVNIGHLSFLLLLHAFVAVLAGCCNA